MRKRVSCDSGQTIHLLRRLRLIRTAAPPSSDLRRAFYQIQRVTRSFCRRHPAPASRYTERIQKTLIQRLHTRPPVARPSIHTDDQRRARRLVLRSLGIVGSSPTRDPNPERWPSQVGSDLRADRTCLLSVGLRSTLLLCRKAVHRRALVARANQQPLLDAGLQIAAVLICKLIGQHIYNIFPFALMDKHGYIINR